MTSRAIGTPNFSVIFPEVQLTVEEIWPDGNAPENPTAEDVVAQMRATGSVSNVMSEWGLMPVEFDVFGNHDGKSAVFR